MIKACIYLYARHQTQKDLLRLNADGESFVLCIGITTEVILCTVKFKILKIGYNIKINRQYVSTIYTSIYIYNLTNL